MNPATIVRQRGGAIPTLHLREQGVTKERIAAAVSAGSLVRPRRGWIACPDADPMLLTAATRGIVLTCITQARRLGLWSLDDSALHIARPRSRSSPYEGYRIHWGRPILPRPVWALEDPLPNALIHIAKCQPYEHALIIWESALNKRLIAVEELKALPLPPSARRLIEEANPFADSGLETIVSRRLAWMGVRLVRQAFLCGRRVDLLIGERLVLQIDGGHHVGAQRDADNRHDAELMLRGYHVIRVGYHQVMNDWPAVQQLIMSAIAQRLHLPR